MLKCVMVSPSVVPISPSFFLRVALVRLESVGVSGFVGYLKPVVGYVDGFVSESALLALLLTFACFWIVNPLSFS